MGVSSKLDRTPVLSLKQENLRLSVLNELAMIKQSYGNAVVAKILLHSSQRSVVKAAQHWVKQGDGSLSTLLTKAGVHVSRNGREFKITDGQGTFSFTDDFYYSGYHFLLKKISHLFSLPSEFLVATRLPSSLKKDIEAAGYWEEARPVAAARDYLVSLHETAKYPKTLLYKMQGGEFTNLRPLVFKQFEIEGPRSTPYTRSAVGFKTTEFVLQETSVEELWAAYKKVLYTPPTELLNTTLCAAATKKDMQSFTRVSQSLWDNELTDDDLWVQAIQDYFTRLLTTGMATEKARKTVLGVLFRKRELFQKIIVNNHKSVLW